jgi:lipase chaperone LimK
VPLAAALVVLPAFIGIGELAERAEADRAVTAAPRSGDVRVFAASMRGTQPDGRLTVHRNALELNPELLHLFEYYLSAQGEKSREQIEAAIRDDLLSRLSSSPAALAQAEGLLSRYLEYRKALLALPQAGSGASAGGQATAARLQARFQQVRQLRAQFFSPHEASAFFFADELRDADAIRRLNIFENASLSLTEKQAAYEQLDLNLPPPLRQEREAPLRIQTVEQQVALMRTAGATEQDVHHFRAVHFSADAASRLEQVDREQQFWVSRIQQYDSEARRLLRLPDGPLRIPASLPPAQQVALDDLRARLFNPQERRRLAAYEVRD